MVGYDFFPMKKKNPEWLKMLLQTKFFQSCLDHEELRKNEMNVFCIDCRRCICQHCAATSPHLHHNQLQIRRYVYHDVVRLHDIQKLLDCSRIQPYTINSAKVVFLNPRPQSRPSTKSNGGGACCKICERILAEPNRFCSIACKDSLWNSFSVPELSDISTAKDEKVNANTNGNGNENAETLSNTENSPQPDSPELHDSGDDNWLSYALKPKRQLHKRKGVPRRAPIC